jgi:hypothetical protein
MAVKKTAKKANKTTSAAKPKKRGPGQKGTASTKRIEKLVEEAIGGIEKRLADESSPPSIGDYLKVMQLQKELEDEAPKEIKITWVEPGIEATPESEK